MNLSGHNIAVIGAGPAGLYAVKQLASQGARVTLINRDIKPGGLAEYGIFHKKHKMKDGLRKQFRKIIDQPNVHYFGNVKVGEQADINLGELRDLGFSAVLVTVGAQKTRNLGLLGEGLKGVYHAKEIVSHFNHLPPYSTNSYPLGNRLAIIGVGNVMVDVANLAIHSAGVSEITAIARRSIADVKFSKKEFTSIYPYMDQKAFSSEIDRISKTMLSAGQDVESACTFVHSAQSLAEPANPETKFVFRFLSQPIEILGDESGKVTGLLLEDTTLTPFPDGGKLKAVGLGTKSLLKIDSVVLCIGNDHDPKLGLPLNKWNEFAYSPNPRFPIDEISYESYNPENGEILEDVFLAGWAREPNKGLVGNSRKDGINGALAITEYLKTIPEGSESIDPVESLKLKIEKLGKVYVNKEDLKEIEANEREIGLQINIDHYKFKTNKEMLSSISLADKQKIVG